MNILKIACTSLRYIHLTYKIGLYTHYKKIVSLEIWAQSNNSGVLALLVPLKSKPLMAPYTLTY